MPEISRFFGIIITMYADDHPPPHFHARYGEYNARFEIESGDLMEGSFPKKQLRLIQAWTELHRDELIENWEESQKDNPEINKIEPIK
ncbi:MAG: DUF4160 domain-containing protein [Bacteroidota bacterium]